MSQRLPARYTIVRLIGSGGMGQVYRARDTLLQRNVALKVLLAPSTDELGSRPDRIARMLREARAVAALEHANIVTIHDIGEFVGESGEPSCYIAMELIEGRSLRHYIGRKDVALETRVAWLCDLARALAFAHAKGIVHRDVKPENVMIREDGVLKVLDFGIARRAAGTAGKNLNAALPTLTGRGIVLGTSFYMAPEQMLGAVLDGRVDQFSWGVVAYELLAGRYPWPAVRTLDQSVSPRLAEVVHRAMARDRQDRFESMDAALDAIEGVASSRSVRCPKHGWTSAVLRWQRTGVSLAIIASAVGWAALGAVWIVRHGERARAASEACTRDADCGSGRVCNGGTCEPQPRCHTNAECRGALGAPGICRSGTKTCAALGSVDCQVYAEAPDLEDDATVWFGAMFPLVGDDAKAFGKREFQAVDLARSDFAQMLRGANARRDAKDVRPLALVACDDSVDPTRAARHLVDDVGVPAVIGFRTSTEVIDLATSIFIPRGVLTVAALNTSPYIASLPRAPGQPRMVFRTTYSTTQAAAPIGALVSDVLEPQIRAQARSLHADNPLRVALVRQDDAAGAGFADAIFGTLRFNGRSALENESNYREIAYAWDPNAGRQPDFAEVVDKLVKFAPQIVLHFGSDDAFLRIAGPLERAWTKRAVLPRYVTPSALTPSVLAFAAKSAERGRRFFSITSVSETPANARFVARYSELYAENVTRTFSPNSSYDAFYLLADATFALGHEPVTGISLARAIGRLLPPGRPIDVGPSGIFDALNELSAGGRIDLNGATGRLDFDPDTGEAPVDLAVFCVGPDANGGAPGRIESGLVYDGTARVLRGTMHCP